MTRGLRVILFPLALLPLLAACGPVSPEQAQALFESTCSRCHSIETPLGQRYDLATWESTVRRMSAYSAPNLGPISQRDQRAIAEYLERNAGKKP